MDEEQQLSLFDSEEMKQYEVEVGNKIAIIYHDELLIGRPI